MMKDIELRLLERAQYDSDGSRMWNKQVLQYRRLIDSHQYENVQHEWTLWTDVPIVEEC